MFDHDAVETPDAPDAPDAPAMATQTYEEVLVGEERTGWNSPYPCEAPLAESDRTICLRPYRFDTSPRARRILNRLIAAHTVADRIVVECGGCSTNDIPWTKVWVVPATLRAIRHVQDYHAWVRLVMDPQRIDFERGYDQRRVVLSRAGIWQLPYLDRLRVHALNPWARYPWPDPEITVRG